MKQSASRRSALWRIAFYVIVFGLVQKPASGAEDGYPSRPVHIIVPLAAGGATDILARPIAAKLHQMLGQPFVVENRGGAGGNIGGEVVAHAAPDGYTILFTSSGLVVANKFVFEKMNFDPDKDFVPIVTIASLSNVLVVPKKSPFNSVRDIIDSAKKEPGRLFFGSGGVGTSNHLAGELFEFLEGIDIKHVPYRGGGPAVIAALSGEVSMLFATVPTAIGHINSGEFKPLAVTGESRSPLLPEVPTMNEAGVSGFTMDVWIGALAPRNTSPEIVAKLNGAIGKVLMDPEVVSVLKREGYEPAAGTPQEMEAKIQKESALWQKVIAAAGSRIQ